MSETPYIRDLDHYSAQNFADEPSVSRETFENFQVWGALLQRWNAKINLVSPVALKGFWARHAFDSWQVTHLLTGEETDLLDLGSGAGFPGLALAIACKSRGQGHVTLVESAGKKANFLRSVIRELSLPATVWADRAEKLPAKPYDIISARAFAPLPRLLTYAQPFWGEGTCGLFLKGQGAALELTEAEKDWIVDVEMVPSLTDDAGHILKVTDLRSRD